MHDFYKISKEKEMDLLYDGKEKSYEVFLDELDCSKSWSRTSTDKTFEEIVEIYKNSDFKHFVFIKRNYSQIFPNYNKENLDHLEIGIRTTSNSGGKDYFIFINIEEKYLEYFVKKYNLIKIN